MASEPTPPLCPECGSKLMASERGYCFAHGPTSDSPPDADAGEVARMELARLLGMLLDSKVLPGHLVADEDWDRMCLLAGRYCEPFLRASSEVSK